MDRRFSVLLAAAALVGAALYLWFLPAEQQPAPRPTPTVAEHPSASPSSAPASSEALPPSGPGRPGLYILAMTWLPAFCSVKQSSPECSDVAPVFVLHGLWPVDQYCDVSDALRRRDLNGGWQSLPATALSASTRSALAGVMPGTRSALDRHEWITHGTCSGTSADRYFARAAGFAAAIRASSLTRFFTQHRGKIISRDDFMAAADAAFGKGMGSRFRLSCDGQQVIDEVTVALYGNVAGGNLSLSELLRATRSKAGGCESGMVR